MASVWSPRKNPYAFNELVDLLGEEYGFIMVGVDPEIKAKLFPKIISIERTNSVDEMCDLYSIADVLINPTLEDNYPTVNLEAIACKTPVITYNTGGSPESAHCPNCVVEKNDIKSIASLIKEKIYTNSIKIDDINDIGKKKMSKAYLELFE